MRGTTLYLNCHHANIIQETRQRIWRLIAVSLVGFSLVMLPTLDCGTTFCSHELHVEIVRRPRQQTSRL